MAPTEASALQRWLAIGCHLWCFLGPLAFLSVVLRLTGADRDRPLVRSATTEVLGLQLIAVPVLAAAVVTSVLGWSLAGFACLAGWVVLASYAYVVGAIGAFHAWHSRPWRYPLNCRWPARHGSSRPDR